MFLYNPGNSIRSIARSEFVRNPYTLSDCRSLMFHINVRHQATTHFNLVHDENLESKLKSVFLTVKIQQFYTAPGTIQSISIPGFMNDSGKSSFFIQGGSCTKFYILLIPKLNICRIFQYPYSVSSESEKQGLEFHVFYLLQMVTTY